MQAYFCLKIYKYSRSSSVLVIMRIVIIGAREDGHARVVLDAIRAGSEHTITGFIDDNTSLQGEDVLGVPVLGNVAHMGKFRHAFDAAIVAVGDNTARMNLSMELAKQSISFVTIVHPRAIVAADVQLGTGTFVAAGAIINTGTIVGNSAIINTGATVDHDNIIDNYVHVGPGVHTAGRVHVGQCTFLGIGSRVIPDVIIGKNVVIGAGAVVLKNVPDGATCVGVPARVIKVNGVPVDE